MNKLLFAIALTIPLISNAQIPATKGYIYTDKGSPIAVYKVNEGQGMLSKANNIGWTFGDGEFWIHNNQVPTILRDEYKEVSFQEIKDKDILVRYDESGKVQYTLTACKPPKNSTICYDKPHPSLFLFILETNSKINHPETTKIYRYIDNNK